MKEEVEFPKASIKRNFILKIIDKILNFLSKLKCICVSKCCNLKCKQENNYLTEKEN